MENKKPKIVIVTGVSPEQAAKFILDMIRKDLQAACGHRHGVETKLLKVTATCETTVTVCASCKKELDEPITTC